MYYLIYSTCQRKCFEFANSPDQVTSRQRSRFLKRHSSSREGMDDVTVLDFTIRSRINGDDVTDVMNLYSVLYRPL